MKDKVFDVIVVGAGHAGVEAAQAAARLGCATVLVTMDEARIAQMSCNPAIGGLAKGQIVREIDALGGLMGLAADEAGIQFRMLNRSKGPAVWGPRAQADKWQYVQVMRRLLSGCPGLTIVADTAARLRVESGGVRGIVCASGRRLDAAAVVLTTGTFLRGLIHIGDDQTPGGRYGEPAAGHLSESLQDAGLRLERLKTGTPPRLAADSVDCGAWEIQPGDAEPIPFSFLTERIERPQICCWIGYTNDRTHEIIRENLDRAPLYTGRIQGVGPRYCPSIETKIVRFADKRRHQLFLEPEGLHSNWLYCNGISTSLPRDVQDRMVRSIEGLERARILRYGYAIEYDYVPPMQIRATLEAKGVAGLFLAGQINGTSGYEEAAGQGLIAGVNAARQVRGLEPVILRRDQAYIGVMIDDLVTKGIDEPYRMFTSRAEYRLLLRSDNADSRLTPLGRRWRLVSDERWRRFRHKRRQTRRIRAELAGRDQNGRSLAQLLRRPDRDEGRLLAERLDGAADPGEQAAWQQVVNDIRYAGYIAKQQRLVERFQQAEKIRLPANLDYSLVEHLRCEAREKLTRIQPANLGQASRISGINPADITVLMVFLRKRGI